MNRTPSPTALRILLVEDSRSEAIYIERTLTRGGPYVCKIIKAYTIAMAAAMLEAQEFDDDDDTERAAMENGAQDYMLKERASFLALTRSMRHAATGRLCSGAS
jgi:PleD family two-component response regulator